MKSIFIPLCILLVLLISLSYFSVEYFVDQDPLLAKYNTFIAFYNPFMENWSASIITSMGTDTKVQPSTSPSSGGNTSTPPQPTNAAMSEYVLTLSKKEGISFPPVTDPFPTASTLEDVIAIQSQIPKDPQPFQNALDWMNTNLEKAHSSMAGALSAIGNIQGFEDICQQITACKKADADAVSQDMSPLFDSFNTDSLRQALQKNQDLIVKSKEIQKKAQNGSLLPSAPIMPSPYKNPAGSDKLQRMKEENPEKYREYEKNYSGLFSIKQSFDQINGSLR